MEVIVCERGDNFRLWANQWKAEDPKKRVIHEFRPKGGAARVRQQAREVFEKAAAEAGRGGTVIVSVGHGGAGTKSGWNDGTVGMVDLAPKKLLRLQRAQIFYSADDRESDEKNVETLRRLGDRCKQLARRKKRGTLEGDDEWDLARCNGAPDSQEQLSLRRAYEDIGKSFKKHGIAHVVLLTCRVGSSELFVDQIARDWGVKVTAYRRRIVGGEDSEGKMRVYLQGDEEGQGTNSKYARGNIPKRDRYTTTGGSDD